MEPENRHTPEPKQIPESITCEADSSVTPSVDIENQNARASLRERYLRMLAALVGAPAKFEMCSSTEVTAEYHGASVDGSLFYVRNLATPLGVLPDALLRTGDIIKAEVKIVNKNPDS